MGTADQLLDLMFSWIEKMESCAEKLRKLAEELESLREKCNASECVGNSVAVLGSACLIGAGALTLFTGGLAAPFLAGVGAVYTGVGVTISVATKITEGFISSATMKDAQKIYENSNDIGEKIQQLFQKLKNEKLEMKPSADPDELDQHVMTELLTAIGRRFGLEVDISSFRDEYQRFSGGSTYSSLNQSFLKNNFMITFTGILAFFSFKAGGKQSKLLFAVGAKQLIKEVSSTGFKTFLKGGGMVVGGAVGMAFSLPDAIDNWTDLIKRNNVTEASQSLRDTADGIRKMTKKLRKQFDDMKCMFRVEVAVVGIASLLLVKTARIKTDETETIKVGLLNVRSLNNKAERIRNLIIDKKLDVFLTTETWLQPNNADTVLRQASPPKFSFFHQERGGRGVAVISEALNPTHELEDINTETFDYVAVELKRGEWLEPVLLVNLYRPPGLEKFEAFLEEFDSFLEKVHVKYKSVIVISDILAVEESTHQSENIQHRVIAKNVEISELQKDKLTSNHHFFKFKARPKDANKEHEVQTMVVLNVRSVDIKPSTIPNLMKDKTLDVFHATQTKKRGGGVAIQYKEDLNGVEKTKKPNNPETFEYVAAVMKRVLWINVYRPPGLTKAELEAFLEEFKKFLDELSVGYKSIIITGDFNIHVDVKTEPATRMFEEFLEENNLTQHVGEPTHQKGHTLDLVITRNVEISDLRVRDDDISDHCTVYFTMMMI